MLAKSSAASEILLSHWDLSGDRYYTTVAHQTGALTIRSEYRDSLRSTKPKGPNVPNHRPASRPKPPAARLNFLGGHLCGSSIRRSWFYGSRPGLQNSIPPDSHRLTLEDIVSVEGIGETAALAGWQDDRDCACRTNCAAVIRRGLAGYSDRFHRGQACPA